MEWIDVEALVVGYQPAAMTDFMADGSHVTYDATAFELLAPPELRGRELGVFHDAPVAADSPWRRVGCRVAFRLIDGSLEAGHQVFAGAIEDLRVLAETATECDLPEEPGEP